MFICFFLNLKTYFNTLKNYFSTLMTGIISRNSDCLLIVINNNYHKNGRFFFLFTLFLLIIFYFFVLCFINILIILLVVVSNIKEVFNNVLNPNQNTGLSIMFINLLIVFFIIKNTPIEFIHFVIIRKFVLLVFLNSFNRFTITEFVKFNSPHIFNHPLII